jgi:hypothetical protein
MQATCYSEVLVPNYRTVRRESGGEGNERHGILLVREGREGGEKIASIEDSQ